MFKFYFLRRKKKIFFTKLKWFFYQKRIIWHQLATIYGKKIKNLVYSNHKVKTIFNSKFGKILSKLELRLNIIIIRLGFVNKLLEANELIKNKEVLVNGLVKNKYYIISVSDLLLLKPMNFFPMLRSRKIERRLSFNQRKKGKKLISRLKTRVLKMFKFKSKKDKYLITKKIWRKRWKLHKVY